MQTKLAPQYQGSADGAAAESILRKCVHCGFCTATCPTYQLLGDELDGPRGRIYLIKQVLEGQPPTRKTQLHLDRCLTCRNCETTCPSGVDYGHLVDIGRKMVDAKVPRPAKEKVLRWALKEGLSSPLFAPAMRVGQWLRAMLPPALQNKVPRLQSAGVQTLLAPAAGCCGALKFHLNDQAGAMVQMRANIDAWWPYLDGDDAVEAIVMNASGCGVTVKEYGHILRNDPAYAQRASRVSALTRDLSELLPDRVSPLAGKLDAARVRNAAGKEASETIAFHPPCTLQHGQQLRGVVEQHLGALGFKLRVAVNESHLCCGSAGTYSVLNPDIAQQLRDRKLEKLAELAPALIVSANIGCISHLQSGTATPVRHWVELLDQALIAQPR